MISLTNVDLPEPLTPVTTVITFNGILTLIFFKLCSAQPINSMALFHLRRFVGTGICFSPQIYFAVIDLLITSESEPIFIIFSMSPSKTTSPPLTPAYGPMSMIWSALRIISSSCSTTMTVLPMSRNLRKTFISRCVSRE